MTNNPTIGGVSLLPCPFCAKPAKMDVEEVRGDDAWCFIRCSTRCKVAPYVGDSACVWYWSEGKKYRHQSDEKAIDQAKDRAVSAWNKRAEVTALQSTIARLEARVAELESGRGEIIHQIRTHGSDCWEDISGESLELCQCDPEEYEIRKLFTAPPVPVAPEKYDDVLLPFLSLMRAELHANAHKGDRPGWLQMDSKTAILEVFYHMGKLHQAVHRNETAAIKEYAADVANMCMMLLDVCACLDESREPNS